MKPVFADASYFAAFSGPNDSFHARAVELSETLIAGIVQILPASQKLIRAGFDLFARRQDKNWSLVDCVSFVVMKQHRLKDALTTDQHFVQAGFRALVRDGH